jgi:hypothetical protein
MKYHLFVKDGSDEEQEIASAVGSDFWTELVDLAESVYGEENVRYTYSE